jgi:chromosome segregation ATPase
MRSFVGNIYLKKRSSKSIELKCNKFKQEYQVNAYEFKSSNALKNLIESQSYLSEEESSFKEKLKESIRDFFQLNDAYNLNKTQLESFAFRIDHFHAMRFQIDEQREELKKIIDDIALEMISETEKYEAMYLNNLKKDFFKITHFDETKTLESELNEIEETFRNSNLLIQAIQDMRQKQDASMSDIQFKLNQMSLVKVQLKATNDFQPNLSLFNQNSSCFFGSNSIRRLLVKL